MEKKPKSKKKWIAILLLIIIAAVGVGAWYFLRSDGADYNAAEKTYEDFGNPSDYEPEDPDILIGNTDYSHVDFGEYGVGLIPNELIIAVDTSTAEEEINGLADEIGGKVIGYLKNVGMYQIQFTKDYSEDELENIREAIKGSDIVEDAFLNYGVIEEINGIHPVRSGLAFIDWKFNGEKGGFSYSEVYDKLTWKSEEKVPFHDSWRECLNIDKANSILYKKYICIRAGVIDYPCIDIDHEDLIGFSKDNLWLNQVDYKPHVHKNNYTYSYAKENDMQLESHGTHVTGIISARGNKSVKGVDPTAEIWFASGFSYAHADGQGNITVTCPFNTVGEVDWLVKNGVRVINWSMGNVSSRNETIDQMRANVEFQKYVSEYTAVLNQFYVGISPEKRNSYLVVKSAGNERCDVEHDFTSCALKQSNIPTIIVGNMNNKFKTVDDKDGTVNVYDSFWSSNFGNLVDVFAPGSGIRSTVPENKYDEMDGTSQAAPIISGIACLALEANPDLTSKELKELITSDENRVALAEDINGKRYNVPDAEKIVKAALDMVSDNSAPEQTEVSENAPEYDKPSVVMPDKFVCYFPSHQDESGVDENDLAQYINKGVDESGSEFDMYIDPEYVGGAVEAITKDDAIEFIANPKRDRKIEAICYGPYFEMLSRKSMLDENKDYTIRGNKLNESFSDVAKRLIDDYEVVTPDNTKYKVEHTSLWGWTKVQEPITDALGYKIHKYHRKGFRDFEDKYLQDKSKIDSNLYTHREAYLLVIEDPGSSKVVGYGYFVNPDGKPAKVLEMLCGTNMDMTGLFF